MKEKLLLIIYFLATSLVMAQLTSIDDANFEQALIDQGYDNILDGSVITANIQNITFLNLTNDPIFNVNENEIGLGITNLTGIRDFTSLQVLWVQGNNLTALDLEGLSTIQDIRAFYNNLESLNINGLSNLKIAGLDFNNISTLNLSTNTSLEIFDIANNNLLTLDISGLGALTGMNVQNNSLLNCVQVESSARANSLNNNPNFRKNGATVFDANCPSIYTQIPDVNFEQSLLDQGIDSQGGLADGRILTTDINSLTILDISNKGINDLSGIEDFTSIQNLNVSFNNLNSLSLQNNSLQVIRANECNLGGKQISFINNGIILSNVTTLELHNNDIGNNSTISFTGVPNVRNLDVRYNNFSDIANLSSLTQLTDLNVVFCNLNNIDVSQNGLLSNLYVFGNNLTTLNTNNNSSLTELLAGGNFLTSVTISNNILLTKLDFSENNLNVIGLPETSSLQELNLFSNNLTSLDISKIDANLATLNATNNSALTCIQVSNVANAEGQINWQKDSSADYNVNCSANTPYGVAVNLAGAGNFPNYEITEGNTFTLNFEADNTTTNGTQFTPNIDFTINGSSAVTDFRFNGNETTIPNSPFTVSAVNPDGSITITAFDDGVEEGNEVYTITITSQNTSSYTINGPTSFDVTVKDKIIDNLFDVNITLGGDIINMGTEANPDYQINEGGTILINIEAYNGGIEGQEYNLSYRDNLAEIPNDFERKFDIDPELLLLFFTPNINTNPDTTYSIEATRDNTIDDQVDYINLSFQNDQQSLPEYRINNLDINSVLNFTIKIIDIDDTNSAFIFANFDNSGGTEGGTDTFTVNLTAGGNPWQNNTGADIILPITFTNARLDGSTIDLAEIGDYTPSNGNIVIAPNTSQGSMTIDLVRDSDKDHEFYLATIEQPTAISITLTNSTMEAKIIDEEAPFDIFVLVKQVSSIGDYKGDAILEGTLCCPEYAVEEGQKIEIAFEAEKGVQPQPFTIKYDFGGVAIENTDFTNLDERAPAPNNQFGYNVKLDKNPDNFLQMQVTKDADYYEQTEKLLINLTPIESSKFNLNKTSFTFNIYNVLPVSVEAIDNIANEEDALNDKGKFLLSLPVLTTRSIYVEYELSGSAIEGVDYVSIEKGVIFNEGEINKEITISAIQDDFPEELETIKLSIIDRPGYSIDNSKREATIDIPKNDQDKITFNVTLTALESQIFENPEDTPNEAAFEITITPPNTTGTDIEINYAFTNGNETYFAIENEDFIQNGNGTLIFGDGETTKQITVSAILDEDIIPEQTEIITLALTQGLKYDSNATTDAKMKIISKDFDNTRLDKESLKVVVTSNSCKDFSEGDLLIENSSQFEFDVFVKKSNSTENPKTGELLGIDKEFFNDLESGEYTITFQFIDSTITIIPPIFIVRIEELSGTNLLGQSFNLKTKTATLLVEGSKEYVVTNEAGLEYQFKFKDFNKHSIEIPVKSGLNNITIKGEANCQGELQSSFYFNDFVVYPNPTKGVLFINGFSLNELANVAITDYSGKQLMSFKKQIVFGNLELDLSNLAQGVYYGAIKTPKGQDLKLKIVKN